MEPNPFDISDEEGSSDGDITKIFETDEKVDESGNVFDFDKWINDHKLGDIKQCFIDHNMINLDTLKLTNPNFAKLTGDQRVLAKPLLFSYIVNGIQSLDAFKASNNDNNDDIKEEGAKPMTTTTKPQKKFIPIIMTQNESKVFEDMRQKIKILENLRNELKIVTFQDFELTRDKNIENIQKYESYHMEHLQQISDKIHNVFVALHGSLNDRNKILQKTVNEYEQSLTKEISKHDDKMREIDRKLRDCLNLIDQDKFQFNDTTKRCKDIIKRYDIEKNKDNTDNKDDIDNESYSFLKINQERETEIIGMGKMAKAHYDKRMIILNEDQEKIELHNKTDLNLPTHDIYSISVNDKVFQSIVDDTDKLFNLKCTEEKGEDLYQNIADKER